MILIANFLAYIIIVIPAKAGIWQVKHENFFVPTKSGRDLPLVIICARFPIRFLQRRTGGNDNEIVLRRTLICPRTFLEIPIFTDYEVNVLLNNFYFSWSINGQTVIYNNFFWIIILN